jgi:glycosyltransferase involved in cell wall biosynthesis
MTSRQQPLVSVVTPVYNGERYLRECIESVLSQSYTHWDYTIVNNCSTDGSLDIAREYAAKDSRIRIHNNETFVRVIANHNIAFRLIAPGSEYCKVVAADDWLFADCLERMVGLAEANPRVAIVGAYGLAGTKVQWLGLPHLSTVIAGREACRLRLLGGPYVFGQATSVLFRSDIVRSRPAFYNESNLHADSEACFEFLEDSDFGFVHQVLTFTRPRGDSLTSYSGEFNTYLPMILSELAQFGPKYLSDEERRQRIAEHLRAYYKYLGEQVFEGRGRDFWRLHRGKLAASGYPLSATRLARAALSRALELMRSPVRTAGGVVRRLRRMMLGAST